MNVQKYLFLISILIFVAVTFAEMPNTVAYRGQLTDETGNALDATVDITFSIFDIATGGTSLWSETQSVVVTDGYFDVELGAVTALDLNFDSQYWVELTIGTETLSPRDKLTPTAFAIRANIANKADSSIYSVSSSADHEGRIGHVRFIPGDGGSITEAAASSETDTIYIAIGGGSTSSTGYSYPPSNIWRGDQGTLSSSVSTSNIYTVPVNNIFYLYGVELQVTSHDNADHYLWMSIYDGTDRYSIASASSMADYGDDMTSQSSPVIINFNPPLRLEAGYTIDYSAGYYGSGTSFYGYHLYGWQGTE